MFTVYIYTFWNISGFYKAICSRMFDVVAREISFVGSTGGVHRGYCVTYRTSATARQLCTHLTPLLLVHGPEKPRFSKSFDFFGSTCDAICSSFITPWQNSGSTNIPPFLFFQISSISNVPWNMTLWMILKWRCWTTGRKDLISFWSVQLWLLPDQPRLSVQEPSLFNCSHPQPC